MARANHQALRGRWAEELKRRAAAGDQAGVVEIVDHIREHVDQIGVFEGQWQRVVTGAVRRGLAFEITRAQALRLYREQDGRCALTGLPISFAPQDGRAAWNASSDASLDRIEAGRGYVPGNVWWLHRDVNRMKLDLSLARMLDLCRLVADREAAGAIVAPAGGEVPAPRPALEPGPVEAVAWFLRDCAEDDPMHSETAARLWHSYQEWCRVAGSLPRSQTAVGRALRSLGYRNERGHVVRWHGLRLRVGEGARV